MADTNTYDVPGTAPLDNMTASAAGAAKALLTAKTARDQTSNSAPGSGYVMPAARAQSSTSGSEWLTEWTQGDVAMAAWVAANTGNKGAAYLWFEKAALLGEATAAWHTKWGTDAAELTVGGSMAEALQKESGGGVDDGLCDTGSQSAGSWSTSNSDA